MVKRLSTEVLDRAWANLRITLDPIASSLQTSADHAVAVVAASKAFNIAGLRLNETDGDPFASWKNVAADKLSASISPNRLDIPELRIVGADAKLIIEDDRSFNAVRLLVKPPAAEPAATPPPDR